MLPVIEFTAKILEIVQETPQVKLFRFAYPANPQFTFYPGQFIMLYFSHEPQITYGRAYSLASSPENKKYFEIGLDKVAAFTAKMFSLSGGETMNVKGPYGKFYFHDGITQDIVLIGGGTGITPLMAIARYCADKNLSNNLTLLYSVRSPELIIYKNELQKLAQQNDKFSYTVTVSRPQEDSAWNGRNGRIDLRLLHEKITAPAEKIYFLCGPKEFVNSVIEMLFLMGVTRTQIKTDVWG